MLRDIPNNTHCFIDANIFYYHLVSTPPLSDECSDFLERMEKGDVIGLTSAVAIAEAVHKVMLAEAVARHGLDRKGLAHKLQRQSDLISGLNEHKKVVAIVRALKLHVEVINLDLLEAASDVSSQSRLLTNDALTIAVMRRLGLFHLATNDDNFDLINGITVWKPR
jgi:predicted nucleic acid-binding protein